MKQLGRRLLAAYLAVFALFTRDPRDSLAELKLLLGSIEYGYQAARDAGRRPIAAAITTLLLHFGELQPFAVIARVRADNARAAHAGIGAGRVIRRLLWLPAVTVTGALVVWGTDALGWIFLAFTIVVLAATLWSARHAGARWLLPLVPLLMIWPFVHLRMDTDRGSVAVTEAVTVSLLLAAALAAHQLWRHGRGEVQTWRGLATLAGAPLWWAAGYAAYSALDTFLRPNGGFGDSARFGLPSDETNLVVGIAAFALIGAYWLLLSRVIARVANRYDDGRTEAIER